MAAPIAVLIAATIARALAKEATKQGVKQLTQNQARIVARKSVVNIAKKRSLELSKSKVLSGKNLDAAIIRANRSSRSTKPIRNAQGLKTTTGQGKTKVTKADVYEALKDISKSPSSGSGNISSVGTVRRVQAKPYVRVTTRTSGGSERPLIGPKNKVDVKLTKRTEGPSRRVTEKKTVQKGRIVRDVKIAKFEKSPSLTKKVSGEKMNSQPQEKVTVQKPLRKTNPKEKGSAVTIRKTQPRKAKDVRAEQQKARRDRLREVLTPRVNPARPKVTPKRGVDRSSRDYNVEDKDTVQGITVRGKFYPNGNTGLPARGQSRQGTIESRLESRSERPTIGSTRRGEKGEFDKEAESRLNEALNPKTRVNAKVKPGKPTRTTSLIKSKAKPSEIKGAIRNQRKVLRQREIQKAAEAMAKAKKAK